MMREFEQLHKRMEPKPPRIEGQLHKKSPVGPFFQLRTFVADNGMLSYSSGRGVAKALPIIDIDTVQAISEERLEFCILFSKVALSTTSHVKFVFRAPHKESYAAWVQGLCEHSEYERRRRQHTLTQASGSRVRRSCRRQARRPGP